MTAALALRKGQLRRREPAPSAHEPGLPGAQGAGAGHADSRQQQVEEGGAAAAKRRRNRRGERAQAIARHIAARSGSRPNHRVKASAPCSTSIPIPSAARCPACRAAVTHAVSLAR